MSKFFMLAGGIVEPGLGRPGCVSAFVAYNPKAGVSRMFKVHGSAAKPEVSELPSATTIDLSLFKFTVDKELKPAVDEMAALGGTTAVVSPKADWIFDVVRRHLKTTEDVDTG